MKLIIAGSRNFLDYAFLRSACDQIIEEHRLDVTEIISGKAPGVDTLGEQYAYERNIKLTSFPAPWEDVEGKPESEIKINRQGKKYWKLAGFYRNKQMLEYGDFLIIFWDMKSPGSKHMINEAKKKRINTIIVNFNAIEIKDPQFN